MVHAGHDKELQKVTGLAAFELVHAFCPLDGGAWAHGRVGIADPGDHLAAAPLEGREVGRVHQAPVDHRLRIDLGLAPDAGLGVVDVVAQEVVDVLRRRHRQRRCLPQHGSLRCAQRQLGGSVGGRIVGAEPESAKAVVEGATVHAADARVPGVAGVDLHPGRGLGPCHQLAKGADLRRGQAGRGLGAAAGQRRQLGRHCGIGAGVDVVDDAVAQAVQRVAGLEHGVRHQLQVAIAVDLVDQRPACGIDMAGGAGQRRQGLQDERYIGRHVRDIDSRRRGQDAVEVLRVTLSDAHGLPSAIGAGRKVSPLMRLAVIGLRQRHAQPGHEVVGRMTEVDTGLRVAREGRCAAGCCVVVDDAVVPRVAHDDAVAARKGRPRHTRGEAEGGGQHADRPADTFLKELAVPVVLQRQAHAELQRVGRAVDRADAFVHHAFNQAVGLGRRGGGLLLGLGDAKRIRTGRRRCCGGLRHGRAMGGHRRAAAPHTRHTRHQWQCGQRDPGLRR